MPDAPPPSASSRNSDRSRRSAAAGEELLEAMKGPAADAVIEQALAWMRTACDAPLLIATARALVNAGVAGLAVRLLRSRQSMLAGNPELGALIEDLALLPTGETPWADLADRYSANCRAILTRRPHLRQALDSIPGPGPAAEDDLKLFITLQGNPQVIRDTPGASLDFVFPFGDHQRLASAVKLGRIDPGSSCLLVGVPSPRLLGRLLSLTTHNGYRVPIDIIEPDPEVIALWLHLVDDPQILSQAHLGFFAGEQALEQYREFRAASLWRTDPTHTLVNHRPGWRPPIVDATFHQAVQALVRSRQIELLKRQEDFYRDYTHKSWASRFDNAGGGDQPPLRLLAVTSRFSTFIQHSMRDLAGAFRRLGCEVELLKEPEDFAADIDTWSILAEKPFDLMIVINHLRYEFGDRIHRNLPYVCWIQDHLQELLTERAGLSVGPLDLVLGRGTDVLERLHHYPAGRLLPVTALTSFDTYNRAPADRADCEEHLCDISYVSHASQTPEQLVADLAAEKGSAFGDFLMKVLGLIRSRIAERGWANSLDRLAFILEAEGNTLGVSFTPAQRAAEITHLVTVLFDRVIRHETLEWVASWVEPHSRVFRLYGRGWENHPTIARFACGEIENGNPLKCLYQASRINLQTSGYSAFHQRLLDGIASGGFVLSRYNPRDFLRKPSAALRQIIERNCIADLDELLRSAEISAELAALLDELHELGEPRIESAHGPRRIRETMLAREVMNYPEHAVDDESLFEAAARGRFLPHHVACDIPGFELTVFRTEADLHRLLDSLVDDEEGRTRLADRMRDWVAEHATYDEIAARILVSLRSAFTMANRKD